MAEATHWHVCPDCVIWWECATTPCAALVRNGNSELYCDPCWGMRKDARVPAHEHPEPTEENPKR